MPHNNEYPGYIKLPKQKLVKRPIRFAFNGQMKGEEDGNAKITGFYLRLVANTEKVKDWPETPEMSVYFRPEEWLDVIDAMKREYEIMEELKKSFEKGKS